MLSHNLGGGVARHLVELSAALEQQAHVLLLKPYGDSKRKLCLELPGPESNITVCRLVFAWPEQKDLLWQMLDWLGIRQTHVHHVLGWPRNFWTELSSRYDRFDLTLHDHCIFSATNRQQAVASARSSDGTVPPVGQYTDALQLLRLAEQAGRVFVPSMLMERHVRQCFATLDSPRLEYRPHPEAEQAGVFASPWLRPLTISEPMHVLCLGMISVEKGAQVLATTARLAYKAGAPLVFHLLGSCHAPLPGNIRRHGSYLDDEIQQLLLRINPHLLWLPALHPETWSYTLSAGLRAGLPVMATQVGVFPERLQERPLSWLHPASFSAQQWLDALLDVREFHLLNPGITRQWRYQAAEVFYGSPSYIADPDITLPPTKKPLSALQLSQVLHDETRQDQKIRQWLARFLLRLKNSPLLAPFVRLIPYRWQRKVKRFITRAPLHEERPR